MNSPSLTKNTGAGGRTRQTTGIVFVDGGTVDSCYLANNDLLIRRRRYSI